MRSWESEPGPSFLAAWLLLQKLRRAMIAPDRSPLSGLVEVVGPMAAHVLLSRIQRVFGNAKRWVMGVHHGLREHHRERYLDEFVFRVNRRKTPQAAFAPLLGIAVKRHHASYQMLIQRN